MNLEVLKELWQYKELFYFLAWRDVKLRYRQTLLGAMWAVIQPLFTMIVFTLLFGRVVNVPSDGIPYPIFYFSALLPWTYFSTTLTQAGLSVAGNASLITKIYFPRIILPASSALVGLIDFGIGSLVLAGMMAYYHMVPTWRLLFWPLLVALLMLFSFAVGVFLSALNVKYRDVKFVIPFLLQVWLFATPIIYPASMVPERFQFLIALNPLTGIIEAFRAICVPDRLIAWDMVATSAAISLAVLAVCITYFGKAEATFSDIV